MRWSCWCTDADLSTATISSFSIFLSSSQLLMKNSYSLLRSGLHYLSLLLSSTLFQLKPQNYIMSYFYNQPDQNDQSFGAVSVFWEKYIRLVIHIEPELTAMSPEHTRWLSVALKRQRRDLEFLGSDGRKVDSHQSLVSLASPMLAQVLLLGMRSLGCFRNKQYLIKW